jgi:23S rRNA (cytidine1920-2'-O)/16S rRNA (cytidine1409-2'-O)-methyltransferase
MKKKRVDKLLMENNFAASIEQARALVMSGVVLAAEKRIEKPSEEISLDAEIRIKGSETEINYVGRGGLKLERALNEFHICPNGYVCLDVGASTGGFTDCLLQSGAKKVFAVDVGTNQIVWKLRGDERVEVRENTNARRLKTEDFPEKFDLIVMDVSFISATKIFPALLPLLKNDGKIITLVKPQFEAAKAEVGAGGIVRQTETHERVVAQVNNFAAGIGLIALDTIESPILGAGGNKEFLVLYERDEAN